MLFAVNCDDADHELSVPTARWLVGSARVAAHGVSIAQYQAEPFP